MGAGRCGSTFVMNKLNEHSGVNIFGEDMGSTLCLLNLLFRISNRTDHIRKHPAVMYSPKTVSSEALNRQLHKASSYIGNEFYFDAHFHENVKNSAEKYLLRCFNSPVTGFKEIRWDLFADLSFLNVLNKYYDRVVYINLTRNVDNIVSSSIRADFVENKDEEVAPKIRTRVLNKQEIIQNFIKKQNPSNVVSGDITTDGDLMDKIKKTIYDVSCY